MLSVQKERTRVEAELVGGESSDFVVRQIEPLRARIQKDRHTSQRLPVADGDTRRTVAALLTSVDTGAGEQQQQQQRRQYQHLESEGMSWWWLLEP